jgi:hypothetical protein
MVMCNEPTMRAPLSGWLRTVFLAQRHQARHFGFGDIELLAAEIGQLDIGDNIIIGCGHVHYPTGLPGSGRDMASLFGRAIAGNAQGGNTI